MAMSVIAVVITGAIGWLAINYFINDRAEDRTAKEFIEEKYGMDAIIVSETEFNSVDGHSYQMAFEEQKDVVFTVTVDVENYSTIYRDDYQAVQTIQQLRQQVDRLMLEIEALGFRASSADELVDHVVKNMQKDETARWINLETDDNYETIELPEIQQIKKLLDLQRQYGIDVQKIFIRNKRDKNFVTLDLRIMEDVHSVKEVEAYVVGSDLRLAGNRMHAKWQDAATQAETARFQFHDDWSEKWISCHQVNDNGDCINLLASVSFAPGELSRQNPHLAEDLNAIFGFFDSIQPKLMTVDLMMTDSEREGNPVRFFLEERGNYASTEQLIEELVKE